MYVRTSKLPIIYANFFSVVRIRILSSFGFSVFKIPCLAFKVKYQNYYIINYGIVKSLIDRCIGSFMCLIYSKDIFLVLATKSHFLPICGAFEVVSKHQRIRLPFGPMKVLRLLN